MAAAEVQLRQDPMMPFVLTGDFNGKMRDNSTKFVRRGGMGERPLALLRRGRLQFKKESWEVRQLVEPSAFVTKANELALTNAPRSDR
ncbi:hypothetical protein BGZ70_005304, partial [Mortierella alpina]